MSEGVFIVLSILFVVGLFYLWQKLIMRGAIKRGNEAEINGLRKLIPILNKFFAILIVIGAIVVGIACCSNSTDKPWDFSDGISDEEAGYIRDMNDWYSEEYGE